MQKLMLFKPAKVSSCNVILCKCDLIKNNGVKLRWHRGVTVHKGHSSICTSVLGLRFGVGSVQVVQFGWWGVCVSGLFLPSHKFCSDG